MLAGVTIIDWPVGRVFRGSDCYNGDSGFDSYPGQIYV